MTQNLRLSVAQFLESVGDDNRLFTSRHLNKRWEDVTVKEMIDYYIANAPIGFTVIGHEVAPACDMAQLDSFDGNPSERL